MEDEQHFGHSACEPTAATTTIWDLNVAKWGINLLFDFNIHLRKYYLEVLAKAYSTQTKSSKIHQQECLFCGLQD
jgi:hypothetical protein